MPAVRFLPLPAGERVGVRGGCSRWISCSPHWHSTKRFRAPAGARVTSPLLVQRRSNQEETTPRWRALQASCLPGARAGYGVFRRDSCPGEKLARIPAGHPADFPPPVRRAIGAPGRAARSKRALLNKSSNFRPLYDGNCLLHLSSAKYHLCSLCVASAQILYSPQLRLAGGGNGKKNFWSNA